jgi:hypothetical protein
LPTAARPAASLVAPTPFPVPADLQSPSALPHQPRETPPNVDHLECSLFFCTIQPPQVLSNEVEEDYFQEQQQERARLVGVLSAVMRPSTPPPPGGAPASPAADLRRRMARPLGRDEVAAAIAAWAASKGSEEQAAAAAAAERWAAAHLGGASHTGQTLASALLAWELQQHEVRQRARGVFEGRGRPQGQLGLGRPLLATGPS